MVVAVGNGFFMSRSTAAVIDAHIAYSYTVDDDDMHTVHDTDIKSPQYFPHETRSKYVQLASTSHSPNK